MSGETRYVGAVDTAKLLRAALKKAFPGTRFSVRTDKYAGGASIRVRYTDGPPEVEVDRVAQGFAGSGFDGMIDLKYSIPREVDGERVQYLADFVFVSRKLTAPVLRAAAEEVATVEDGMIVERDDGTAYYTNSDYGAEARVAHNARRYDAREKEAQG